MPYVRVWVSVRGVVKRVVSEFPFAVVEEVLANSDGATTSAV